MNNSLRAIKFKSSLLPLLRSLQNKFDFFSLSDYEVKGYCENYFWFKVFRSQNNFNYENGLTVGGVRFKRINNDPLGNAICKLFPLTENSEKIFSEILYKSYEIDRNMSAAQILGFDNNHEFANYPIWAMVYPWDGETIDSRFKRYPSALIKNRAAHGLEFDSDEPKHIIEKCYSYEAAMIEARQCIRLLRKIQKYGFKDVNTIPHVLILKKDNLWKWLMGVEGGHRSYINYLLKNPFLFSEVVNIIDISKASKWNNVQNGLYTVDEAAYIFNLVFNGEVRTRGAI